MFQNPLEILAPAGDWEMLRAAVFSGADCVYLGVGEVNARQSARNFTAEELPKVVSFSHARNCKVHAAINILVNAEAASPMEKAVQAAVNAGCDAVILQDLATAQYLHTIAPQMPMHASTQMSIHSPAGVRQMAKLGFSRAILSRELTLAEIAEIAQISPIELEVFIHGALCVSVSGQCYMSAFLGGRSGNQGRCAGPCRLPFSAELGGGWEGTSRAREKKGSSTERSSAVFPLKDTPQASRKHGYPYPAADTFHLSLRDLSILDALPELQRIGVVSAKIEGRLRGPEYCAFVVDCARHARDGNPYDKKTLEQIFSRNGFTDGWFTGKRGKDMFGVRTEADRKVTKIASAKARELYRREAPRVPVSMKLHLQHNEAALTVTDGTCTIKRLLAEPLARSEKDSESILRITLSKTGGTPFFLPEGEVSVETNGFFLPTSTAAALRREALEALLAAREQPVPHSKAQSSILASSSPKMPAARKTERPFLRARFETPDRMPAIAAEICEELILPLWEAEKIPESLRPKTRLWLPRVLFGPLEEEAKARIRQTADRGFLGYEIYNFAHLELCAGHPMSAGFGLNLTNPTSAAFAAEWGCSTVTLSPELSLRQINSIANSQTFSSDCRLDVLCYGHMPLMITRACPLQNITSCAGCPKNGLLADRKGNMFPILCRNGARTIFNPIPLWMGDRLAELPTYYATLYFTTESQESAADILQAFQAGLPAPKSFTRGLYDKGLSRNL